MPAWPASLPAPAVSGMSGGPQSNIASFQPEIGPPIQRKRASAVARQYDVQLPAVTRDQRATFVGFFEDDLAFGSLSFTMRDPFTDTDKTFRFAGGSPAYNEQALASGIIQISFSLVQVA